MPGSRCRCFAAFGSLSKPSCSVFTACHPATPSPLLPPPETLLLLSSDKQAWCTLSVGQHGDPCLKCCCELHHILMCQGGMEANLPEDLVLVQLADGRQLVTLQHHHFVGAFAHGFVHCKKATMHDQQDKRGAVRKFQLWSVFHHMKLPNTSVLVTTSFNQ